MTSWVELSLLFPEEMQNLVSLCSRFSKIKRRIYSEHAIITERDINEMVMLIHRIIGEYMKIIRMSGQFDNDKDIERVRQDIHRTLSRFFDRDGRIIDLSREIINSRREGQVKEFSRTLIAPLMSFVDGRILDSLKDSIIQAKKTLVQNFVISSVYKSGVFPKGFGKGDYDLKLPPVKEE